MKNMSNQIKHDVPQIKGLFCQSFYLLFLFFHTFLLNIKPKATKCPIILPSQSPSPCRQGNGNAKARHRGLPRSPIPCSRSPGILFQAAALR